MMMSEGVAAFLRVFIPFFLLSKIIPIINWAIFRYNYDSFIKSHGCENPLQVEDKWYLPFGIGIFIESLKVFDSKQYLPWSWNQYQKLDVSTYSTVIFGEPIIHTIDPENIRAMLSTKFLDFSVGASRRYVVAQLMGNGIFMVDGLEWERMRALMRPNFTKRWVTNVDMFECHVRNFLARLPGDGLPVDIQKYLFALTLDSTTEFFFGKSVHCLSPESSVDTAQFIEAFNAVTPVMGKRARLGPLGGMIPGSKFKRDCMTVRKFIKDLIRRNMPDEIDSNIGTAEKGDVIYETDSPSGAILQSLLNANMGEEDMCDYLINAVLGGRDTTAGLMSSTFFILARRPDIWAKLKKEVSTLGGKLPTYEQITHMPYLRAVLTETLRLYPVVPTNQRSAGKMTCLPKGGGEDGQSPVFLKKGQLVVFHPYSMHRRKDLFGDDAEEYAPERWLEGRTHAPWSFLPFNSGPRICMGQQMAMTQASYTIIRVLQQFDRMESRETRKDWVEGLNLTCAVAHEVKVGLYKNV